MNELSDIDDEECEFCGDPDCFGECDDDDFCSDCGAAYCEGECCDCPDCGQPGCWGDCSAYDEEDDQC